MKPTTRSYVARVDICNTSFNTSPGKVEIERRNNFEDTRELFVYGGVHYITLHYISTGVLKSP